MELRSRAIPEPWPLPPVHPSLEMEASLLDSGVQELLEPEDVGAYGLTSNELLQWAALTEFPCVVWLFELNCGSAHSGWARRRSVKSCTSFRFFWSEFCQDFCRPRKRAGSCFRGPREFIEFSPDERPLHTPSWVRSTTSTRAVSSIGDVPAPQPLDPVGVLAKSKTVLDKLRSARSLEEEFGMDPGVATTKAEYTEVLNGGRSEGEGLRRLGGHAQAEFSAVTDTLE